jgi:uncharacterized protein (TIGR00290 family)
MERVLVSWSGGKDSALALSELLAGGQSEVAALLTTVTRDYDRISMHGVRRSLLERQAASLGLPLEIVWISKGGSNDEYESGMAGTLLKFRDSGVTAVAFGDIFLEDLRAYREGKLRLAGMSAMFPIWKRDTRELAASFVARGFRAITTCVDTAALDGRFVGREIDEGFLSELPAGVDPCGENGEYHSFVYAGPVFGQPIRVVAGEKVLRDGRFFFCDLVEDSGPAVR